MDSRAAGKQVMCHIRNICKLKKKKKKEAFIFRTNNENLKLRSETHLHPLTAKLQKQNDIK